MNHGCWQLFLIEIPVYPSVDFIDEFRKIDEKVRLLFDNVSNVLPMSEIVPVSFYTDPNIIKEKYRELIDSGELLLEPGGINSVSIDKWVETKYFYKFFIRSGTARWPKRLLKLFAAIGNICEETKREHHYKITFKIITYNNNYTANLEYDDMRVYGQWALDILNGKPIQEEAIYSLASKFFYIFGLEGKYGQEPSQVYKELEDIYRRKKNIKHIVSVKTNRLIESVLDDLDKKDTNRDDLFSNKNGEITYQEWYRKYTKRSSHLIAIYKYFSGENRADEIPMIKDLFEQVVSRYYPDCSEIQVVSNQMSFNEENKKFGIQYEPSWKKSGGVILDGVRDSSETNYALCFKACVYIPLGTRNDFERFLDCIASLYALINYRDSGNYRGGKLEIYKKPAPSYEQFEHTSNKFGGTDDIVGIDAFNYKFDKNKRGFNDDDFYYTIEGYYKFKTFKWTSQEDLMQRLIKWCERNKNLK